MSLPRPACLTRGALVYARHFANRGRTAEQLLTLTHTAYRQSGTTLLVPVPPPIGRLHREEETASRGRFTGFYKRKSFSDYLGTLAPDGRALALELKSVEHDERWYPSQLASHQAAFLAGRPPRPPGEPVASARSGTRQPQGQSCRARRA
ncbi:MAG: Holliday junction resolvase RecU [candidate division NC10 bacterium]|nr:Holliday junction resolvase RecU [candidate division NC10 bacterium]